MSYVEFTREMKRDYTILAPNMLPLHFHLIEKVMRSRGYKLEILETSGPRITELGLKYVHNDACYPAVLVAGQFLDALESGRYDPHRVALILFQTGGGCRASNYIYLLRKALQRAGYGYVPVISLNLKNLEKHSGFKLSLPLLYKMLYSIIYADLMMALSNQCRPYELNKGDTDALTADVMTQLGKKLSGKGIFRLSFKRTCRRIIERYAAIPCLTQKKTRVGVVGEIYVKYSPLGNNSLADFLLDEDAEIVVPGLLDFCLYCVYNNLEDFKLYGKRRLQQPFIKIGYNYLIRIKSKVTAMINKHGRFQTLSSFDHAIERIRGYIGLGVKMGEGWLLPAEMLELYDCGIKNIVCAQPFGCLPNHICGKGMMKPLRDKNPGINIVAIDYDPGASVVNQENRLRLMLANAAMSREVCDEDGKLPNTAIAAAAGQ